MSREWENTVREALEKLGNAIKDGSELTVLTKYVAAGELVFDTPPDTDERDSSEQLAEKIKQVKAAACALTEIKWDGDSTAVIPIIGENTETYKVNSALYDLHVQHVESAQAYRKALVDAFTSTVQAIS